MSVSEAVRNIEPHNAVQKNPHVFDLAQRHIVDIMHGGHPVAASMLINENTPNRLTTNRNAKQASRQAEKNDLIRLPNF